MVCRAIRGAITVNENSRDDILESTKLLLKEIIKQNNIEKCDIISIIFTATKDIDAVYPAVAARELDITDIALLCMQEMYVRGSLEKCIRVLFHINTEASNDQLRHVYLRGAKVLRPDLNN